MRTALALLVVLLAGCGQAGELYLPSEPAATPPQSTPPAPGDTEKKKEE
jgi:predicted small lipoprotein YifL